MARRRILVPINLDAQSDSALDFARSIASSLNAMISCMYVIENKHLNTGTLESGEARLKQRRDAENRLSIKVNSILNEVKIPFELIITSGNVKEKILEKAMDLNVQLIVMSRSGSGETGKNRIGSTTKHIITKSKVPVITMGTYKYANRENIIVPLDVTKPIGSQVISAIDTAILLGAAVTVIGVINNEMSGLRPIYLKRLEETRLLLGDINIHCNAHLLSTQNSVSEEILSYSRNVDSAMILLMTTRKMKANGSTIGSVAREIIANSEFPVQCINPNCLPGVHLDKSRNFNSSTTLPLYSMKDKLINNQLEI